MIKIEFLIVEVSKFTGTLCCLFNHLFLRRCSWSLDTFFNSNEVLIWLFIPSYLMFSFIITCTLKFISRFRSGMLDIVQNRFTCWPISTPPKTRKTRYLLTTPWRRGKDETRTKNQSAEQEWNKSQVYNIVKNSFICWSIMIIYYSSFKNVQTFIYKTIAFQAWLCKDNR